MSTAAFEAALPFILRWEGGYVNHPKDPGGATNRGVTQKVYDGWRKTQGLPPREVRQLDDTEIGAIYESGYWRPSRCGDLPSPMDLVQFDTAVNMGTGRAVRMLQQAVGAQVDGQFGSGTLRCVGMCDMPEAVVRYCNAREAFYRGVVARKPDQGVFLRGWLNRLNALRREAGLPGYESAEEVDFGDAPYIGRIPDFGAAPEFDDL